MAETTPPKARVVRLGTCAVLVGLVATGCGPETSCNLVDAPSGMDVAIAPGRLASSAQEVHLEICPGERSCYEVEDALHLERDGQAGTFVEVGMTVETLKVTMTLHGGEGQQTLRTTTSLLPTRRFPNGEGCPPEVVVGSLRVTDDGTVTDAT